MTQNQKVEKNTPRIYVASLADYNSGRLLGRWIDADQTAEVIHAEIAKMLAESKELVAEEWAIHDYEGFGTVSLSESADIEYVAELAELMGEYGTIFAEVVAHCGSTSDTQEARRYMEEGYCGAFDSLEDYARQLVEDCYDVEKYPDIIKYHIDYEGIGRDMEWGGDVFTIEHGGRVHVFNSNI